MITRIEAAQYRCLRSVSQNLEPFQVLVGPNGSGKTAFLDVVAFLGTLVAEGLRAAIDERSENFNDLVWSREGACFRLAIEARVPREKSPSPVDGLAPRTLRYEVTVKSDSASDVVSLSGERLVLISADRTTEANVIERAEGNTEFHSESSAESFRFHIPPAHSALSSLPLDQTKFPASVWLKELLREGIQTVSLDNEFLRATTAPYQGRPKIIDGFTLPRMVFQLSEREPHRFARWIDHVRTSLPDIESVRTFVRSEDKHRVLMLRYTNGIEVPSWVVSDGTLRLLALTILAYIADFKGIYLVEEPENGVHPTALQTIYQSLSSMYEGQVLVTSHSPILLGLTKPAGLLCFQKTPDGTEIVRGDRHPLLKDWQGDVSLGDLFAAGVLS